MQHAIHNFERKLAVQELDKGNLGQIEKGDDCQGWKVLP